MSNLMSLPFHHWSRSALLVPFFSILVSVAFGQQANVACWEVSSSPTAECYEAYKRAHGFQVIDQPRGKEIRPIQYLDLSAEHLTSKEVAHLLATNTVVRDEHKLNVYGLRGNQFLVLNADRRLRRDFNRIIATNR